MCSILFTSPATIAAVVVAAADFASVVVVALVVLVVVVIAIVIFVFNYKRRIRRIVCERRQRIPPDVMHFIRAELFISR